MEDSAIPAGEVIRWRATFDQDLFRRNGPELGARCIDVHGAVMGVGSCGFGEVDVDLDVLGAQSRCMKRRRSRID